MPNKLLRAALRYARRDWPVLPLHNPISDGCSCGNTECKNVGKHPRTSHGLKDASLDPAIIRSWWNKWPKANIGIVTGVRAGIVVLDSDPRHNGHASLRLLTKQYGPFPKGPQVETGGGGRHFLFKYPGVPVKSKSGILPGVDARGDGGYIVAPPSLHVSGNRYEWSHGARPKDLPLPPLPKWLFKLIAAPSKKPSDLADEKISEGRRNATLTSLAGGMRRQGADQATILAALRKENERRCDPPLDDAEMAKIASSVSRYEPKSASPGGRPSQSTQLVTLAGDVELFHTAAQEVWGIIRVNDHLETWRLRDQSFKRFLASRFYSRFRSAPSTQTLHDALGVLEGRALYESPEQEVFTRLGETEDAIWLDLGNPSWEAIKITKNGWNVVSNPPIRFRRTRGMKALPLPIRGGSADGLRAFLNLAAERDFKLLTGWVLGALNPRGPYAVLVLQGEAGCGKTTTARVLRELVDPSKTPLRSEPRENRDLMIAAKNSWCVGFDNLSNLRQWLSDSLCQLATGGGFATRQLYSDDEEQFFEATRPILLNGIDGVVTRGDLMDRSLVVYLPVIADEHRKSEKEFWREFRSAQPRILGALLDAVACAMSRLPSTKLDRLPRMADFALWVTAAEPALHWRLGSFVHAYDSNRTSANALALEASIIVAPLRRACARGRWKGTAKELLHALRGHASFEDLEQRDWPKNPQVLSTQLRRLAPNLRAAGRDVQFGEKTSGSRSKRIITIRVCDSVSADERPVHKELAEIDSEYERRQQEQGAVPRFAREPMRFPREIQRFPRYAEDRGQSATRATRATPKTSAKKNWRRRRRTRRGSPPEK